MRWVFRAGRPFLPESGDPFAAGLGGTEQAVIALTSALVAAGETVSVAGGARCPRVLDGVLWGGVSWDAAAGGVADVDVAVNDARLLPPRAALPVIWFHNEVALARELRRGRGPALLRARPRAVFIGTEQARGASRLLPFRARHVIPYGLSSPVLRAAAAGDVPAPRALFTSQAYRGLREVLEWWQRSVAPAVPDAVFEALIAEADVPAFRALCWRPGVSVGPRVGNEAVLDRLRQTRVLVAPGHASETFCMAAAEAIALGVPVVTRGIGSLKERVRDGVDGFICRDDAEMAARTRALLTDDALWRRMRQAGVESRLGRSWADVAASWLAMVRG